MRQFVLVGGFVLAIIVACRDNSTPPVETDLYAGRLIVSKWQQSYQWTFIDTDQVLFSVSGAQYEIVHLVSNTTLCNSSGRVRNFGSNSMILTPDASEANGDCDTLRVPQGEFPTQFRGDSLFIGPSEVRFNTVINDKPSYDIMTYKFELKR